jgi:RNA polymerase sigma factor (sigma-70 family)
MTEDAIIRGCLENKPAAQEALYRMYCAKMMAVCYRYARNREDAEDMMQEGFIRIFQQMHQFMGKGSFEGWIRRIMIHTSINHLKKYKKFSDYVDVYDMSEYLIKEEQTTASLHSRDIIECIRSLPVGYKTVLNLFAIEGYTHKEIARILEIEESTSRSQYTRARNMLEKKLMSKNIISPTQQMLRS